MSEILYIQTEKNVEVYQPEVYLQDVAKLACGDSKVLNRKLNTSKNKIKLQNKIINRWNIMPL